MRTSQLLLAVLTVGVSILTASLPAQAPAQDEIAALLKHEIIGNELPLAEVQRYVESRVPKMPACATVSQWQAEADRMRQAVLDRVVFRGEAARWRDASTKVQWLDAIEGGPGYRIKKLRYEALPGMWIPALLYEPDKLAGRVPAVLNVNGHTSLGKQYPPKQLRCINQAKRGLLALNIEWLGMGQLNTGGFSHARHEPIGLVRHQRAGALLPVHETRSGRAFEPGKHRSAAGGSHRPVRRRLADDRAQRPGHPRHADQPRGGLLQFPDAHAALQGPGGFRTDAQRSGDRGRLYALDGDDGAAAHLVDLQCQGRLLF